MSNKVIGIEYTLKDAKTGEQLDTNVGQAPLEFVSGKGQIIKGLRVDSYAEIVYKINLS